ncbi:hypothetical protein [Paraburkholderia phenazinium]|uniref:Helix-turn-helix domain-containing protein n=1 Tax=Paraburkholderia phenazinium TaxID=60549 RepID=A0A1G8FKA4_9BURK|nr:hypothetical protein [Paraburkholderia phenazinium]SDH82574.1 hypothetical protein SAMN05216466_113222 [Paraburkholderia phenazinium]
MPIIRAPRPERDFTVIANHILSDSRLSWAARGMLVHLLSKPDHWSVNVQALVNETQACSRASGRDAVYRTLEELDEAGYIVRKRLADGSVVTTVYEQPVPENPDVGQKPHPEKPDLEKPDRDNPDVLVRTEFIERTEVVERTEGLPASTPTAVKPKTRKGTKITLQAFIDGCKSAGVKAISEDDPIYEWAKKVGVSEEMIAIGWAVFKGRHVEDETKRYADWRAHFRNAMKNNWYRLWYISSDETCALTTVGEMARREHRSQARPRYDDARYAN